MNKIVLAGGTGFLGQYLASKFKERGDEVIIISRSKSDVLWRDKAAIINALEGADLVLNLAGKSVDCRYTEKNKREILRSRVDTTRLIGEAIAACKEPPTLWINSSTATIYCHAEDRPMTEQGGEIGEGFSVDVAKAWEKTFFDFSPPSTRQIALRMAIVLGKEGGVMKPLKRLAKFGLGGKQGKGTQMFSWIHIEDVYRIILFAMENKEVQGVVNCSSPNPVMNKVLMDSLRNALHITVGLPAPEWLLKIGAVLIRTEAELVLKSRWVIPERLQTAGFTFSYPTLTVALEEIVN